MSAYSDSNSSIQVKYLLFKKKNKKKKRAFRFADIAFE